MLTNSQGFKEYREREGISPFRERPNNRTSVRTPLPEQHNQSHQNGGQYGRARHDASDHEMKAYERPYSAKGSQNTRENMSQNVQNQERHILLSFKNRRQLQNYSCFDESESGVGQRRSKMNDFSFEDEFGHHPSQQSTQNVRRENARMRGLEVKMNNIESLNEKINCLLSMVKKDKSREKVQPRNEIYSRKTVEILSNKSKAVQHRTQIEGSKCKQKENAYNYQIVEKQQRQKGDRYGANRDYNYQSPFKTKPLFIREENIDVRQAISSPIGTQKHQKSTIQLQKEAYDKESLYSPPPRRRIAVKPSDNNEDMNNLEQNKKSEPYKYVSPSSRKDKTSAAQPPQKSVEEMLNERRLQRNIKQGEKIENQQQSINSAKESSNSIRNTPKHQKAASQVNDEAFDKFRQRPSSSASNSQLAQIRERIAKLSNPQKSEQNELTKVEEKSLAGRIYKKNEGVTPPRAGYSFKKALQIDENLF